MSGHHHHGYFDPYSRIESPIHHAPSTAKLLIAVALIVAVVTAPVRVGWLVTFFPIVGLLLLSITGMSLIPPGFLLRRIALMEPLVIGVAVLALFRPDGARVFLTLALRSTFCLWIALLLANTTPFPDLIGVLRTLRTPALIVSTIAFMYRYLFVLTEEAQRMQRARSSRTFTPSRGTAWRLISTSLGQLFIRTADRADRVYLAMCARGWK